MDPADVLHAKEMVGRHQVEMCLWLECEAQKGSIQTSGVGQGLRNPFKKVGIFPQPVRDYVVPMKAMKKGGRVVKKKK